MDKRASRNNTDWTKKPKERHCNTGRLAAWQPVTLSDDTLPAVLGTVNKCVSV